MAIIKRKWTQYAKKFKIKKNKGSPIGLFSILLGLAYGCSEIKPVRKWIQDKDSESD